MDDGCGCFRGPLWRIHTWNVGDGGQPCSQNQLATDETEEIIRSRSPTDVDLPFLALEALDAIDLHIVRPEYTIFQRTQSNLPLQSDMLLQFPPVRPGMQILVDFPAGDKLMAHARVFWRDDLGQGHVTELVEPVRVLTEQVGIEAVFRPRSSNVRSGIQHEEAASGCLVDRVSWASEAIREFIGGVICNLMVVRAIVGPCDLQIRLCGDEAVEPCSG